MSLTKFNLEIFPVQYLWGSFKCVGNPVVNKEKNSYFRRSKRRVDSFPWGYDVMERKDSLFEGVYATPTPHITKTKQDKTSPVY